MEIDNVILSDDEEQNEFKLRTSSPQLLVEKIIRERIYECPYWKQHCFAVNAATILEKASKLKAIGGTRLPLNQPTEFLCLTFKLLLITPSKDIIFTYINQDEFKYIRALGAFYLRLVGSAVEVYTHLEPLLNDYRKVRVQSGDGGFSVGYMDAFVDDLLRAERVCDIILPRLTKREVLEELGQLEPRESLLQDYIEEEEDASDESHEWDLEEDLGVSGKLKFKAAKNSSKNSNTVEGKNGEQKQSKESLSIEETNRIRASLGLKPLV